VQQTAGLEHDLVPRAGHLAQAERAVVQGADEGHHRPLAAGQVVAGQLLLVVEVPVLQMVEHHGRGHARVVGKAQGSVDVVDLVLVVHAPADPRVPRLAGLLVQVAAAALQNPGLKAQVVGLVPVDVLQHLGPVQPQQFQHLPVEAAAALGVLRVELPAGLEQGLPPQARYLADAGRAVADAAHQWDHVESPSGLRAR